MDDKRYHDMSKVKTIVGQSWSSFVLDYGFCKALDRIIYRIPERKFQQIGLRSYYTVKMVDYIQFCCNREGKTSKISVKALEKLPMLIELVLCKQYYDNLNFDGKQEGWHPKQLHDNTTASNLLKQTIDRFIDREFEGEERKKINKKIQTIFLKVDIGQAMEKNWNNYYSFEHITENGFKDCKYRGEFYKLDYLEPIISFMKNWIVDELDQQVEVYLNRIYLTCASLFIDLTKLLLQLSDYDGEEKDNIMKFATSYGIMRQMVNDCKDNVPAHLNFCTATKSKSDGLSDIKNRILTGPVLFHLSQEKHQKVQTYLASKELRMSPKNQLVFFREMLKSGAIFQAMKMAKVFRSRAESYLDPSVPASAYLIDSCKIADFNKYYHIYHKYWKGRYLKMYRRNHKVFRQESTHLISTFPFRISEPCLV